MLPDWLLTPREFPTNEPAIGVAIGVSDAPTLSVHVGILHCDRGLPPKVLHHGWHEFTHDDLLPHSRIPFWWVRFPTHAAMAETLAARCRRIARSAESLKIAYALHYDGARLTADGALISGPDENGLSCATFVLAFFEGLNLPLLVRSTWPTRATDRSRHERLVRSLRATKDKFNISEEHIAKVELEIGCVRYRPEEVAAACGIVPKPVPFAQVTHGADAIRHVLLPGAADS
jgi:hypothetical protein